MPLDVAFRRLALALPSAVESAHMGSADFRRDGRIFATLAHAAKGFGTLRLTPEQQADVLAESPGIYTPAPGAWGRKGMTLIRLDAPLPILEGALRTAYANLAQGQPAPALRSSRHAASAAKLLTEPHQKR